MENLARVAPIARGQGMPGRGLLEGPVSGREPGGRRWERVRADSPAAFGPWLSIHTMVLA